MRMNMSKVPTSFRTLVLVTAALVPLSFPAPAFASAASREAGMLRAWPPRFRQGGVLSGSEVSEYAQAWLAGVITEYFPTGSYHYPNGRNWRHYSTGQKVDLISAFLLATTLESLANNGDSVTGSNLSSALDDFRHVAWLLLPNIDDYYHHSDHLFSPFDVVTTREVEHHMGGLGSNGFAASAKSELEAD